MFARNRLFLIPLLMLLILESQAEAEIEKRTLEINLQAVHKDTPYFERSETRNLGNHYFIKMVKIRDNEQFKSLPETDANVLYYGEVKLGSPARTHGILIDLEGKDKLFWIDSDADQNYAEEISYQLFKSDRNPGVNFYYSPNPIVFTVAYEFQNRKFETSLQFDLQFLAVARIGFQDLFFLSTRSWFTGSISIGNNELRVAVVDTNDNGLFQDPEDLMIIDRDYDLNFSPKESVQLFKSKTIKLESKRWNVFYQSLPEKLILTER